MEISTQAEGCLFTYTESFWTGKKELTVNGVPMQKTGKKNFMWAKEGAEPPIPVTVKGNFLSGVSLLVEGRELVLFKNKWYEWILIFLPLIGFALGMLCGAIGAFLCAMCTLFGAVINAQLLRGKMPLPLKIVTCLCITVAMNLVWFFIYVMIVGGLAVAFPGIFG